MSICSKHGDNGIKRQSKRRMGAWHRRQKSRQDSQPGSQPASQPVCQNVDKTKIDRQRALNITNRQDEFENFQHHQALSTVNSRSIVISTGIWHLAYASSHDLRREAICRQFLYGRRAPQSSQLAVHSGITRKREFDKATPSTPEVIFGPKESFGLDFLSGFWNFASRGN